MKKIFSIMAVAALTLGFTACEDIPSPYEIFDEIVNGDAEDIYYESTGLYTGWNLVTEEGFEQPWSQGSSYTQATGYQKWDEGSENKSNKEVKGYLVSPSFNTKSESGKVCFSFDNTVRYANNVNGWENNHRIYVSADYEDGADFNTATWELIDWKSTESPYSDWTVYTSGNIALPEKYINQKNVHLAFYFYAPASGSTTWELMNFVIEEGEADYQGTGFNPEDTDTPTGPSAEPVGDGSQASPFNVAATIDFVNKLKENTESEPVYIKGIVKKFKSGEEPGNSYGNATFYIVDTEDASEDFYCYRVMGPGNKAFTSADQLKVGDEVVIYGPLTLYSSSYGTTPETVQKKCYVYSINGKVQEGEPTPEGPAAEVKGDGTAANPYNVAGVLSAASALAADAKTDNDVYFTGIICDEPNVDTDKYGNATFHISDDGKDANSFYVFRCYDLENNKFTEAKKIAKGDKVTLCGKLTNYKGNTPETVANESYLVKIEKGENAGNDTPPAEPEFVPGSSENGDFETWSGSEPAHWKTTSTAGNAKLTQSTDAHGGKYSVEVEGVSGTNKRIGREEMTLEAGDYTMTFWVKAATSTGASIRPGYVPVTDGKVGGYSYGEYTNDIPSDKWIQVTHNFTISNTGVYSLVIMNSGNPGGSVLVDDFVLTKGDTKIISSRKRSSQVTKRVVRK